MHDWPPIQERDLQYQLFECGAQVVCATCTGAGDGERLGARRYKMVVIDEATQSTEPSCLIPLVRPSLLCHAALLLRACTKPSWVLQPHSPLHSHGLTHAHPAT